MEGASCVSHAPKVTGSHPRRVPEHGGTARAPPKRPREGQPRRARVADEKASARAARAGLPPTLGGTPPSITGGAGERASLRDARPAAPSHPATPSPAASAPRPPSSSPAAVPIIFLKRLNLETLGRSRRPPRGPGTPPRGARGRSAERRLHHGDPPDTVHVAAGRAGRRGAGARGPARAAGAGAGEGPAASERRTARAGARLAG